MKKSFLLLIIIIMVMSASVKAQSNERSFSISGYTAVLSQYVTPNGLATYDKVLNQGSVTLSHKSGLYLDLWYSAGFNFSPPQNWDDELDYSLGWSGKISKFDADFCASYFDCFNILSVPYNDVIKLTANLKMEKEVSEGITVLPFVKYFRFIIPDKSTPIVGGNLFSLGMDTKFDLSDKFVLRILFSGMYDDGTFKTIPGFLVRHTTSLDFKISKHIVWNTICIDNSYPIGNRQMTAQSVLSSGLSFR